MEEDEEEEGETGCLLHMHEQAKQRYSGRRKELHFSRPPPEDVGATLLLRRR